MEEIILQRVSKELSSPVVQYSNVIQDKLLIIEENKGKAGIYRWVNNLNGYSYIGSSKDLGVILRVYEELSI